jgi:choline dehydrogenase
MEFNVNEEPLAYSSLEETGLKKTYDHIIVGAGSAGCLVARRLLDDTDATILLLEGGSDNVNILSITVPCLWLENKGATVDYQYEIQPTTDTDHNKLPLPRGKVLRGSGSINGMLWAGGHKDDHAGWAAAGNVC